MKISLKILSVTLALIMLLSYGIIISADTENADVSYEKYEMAANTLFRLGVLSKESFSPSDSIKKGDFLNAAMHLLGSDSIFTPCDTIFSDVKADDKNSGAVNAAVNMGIIDGRGDGTFGKDDFLQIEQAAKILVSILGYDVHARSYGGYPSGYLTVATMQGILKGVTVGNFQNCRWDEAAQLIYNALHTDILQAQNYPEEKFVTVDGENPMTKWMGVFSLEGTVGANDITALSGVGEAALGKIKMVDIRKADGPLNGNIFIENETGLSSFVGYPVKLYYTDNGNGILSAVSYKLLRDLNEKYVTSANISPKTTQSALYVMEGNDDVAYNISNSPVVFYNGKVSTNPLTSARLQPKYGSVSLINTDGDNEYDIVKIYDKKVYFVEEISARGLITDTYGEPSFKLPIDDKDAIIKVTLNGNAATVDDIKVRQVLSVSQSEDKKYVEVEISTLKTKGVLEETAQNYVKISGEEFEIAYSAESAVASSGVGERGIFYFTSDYYLAGIDVSAGGASNYAYSIVGSVQKSGLTETASIRFYDIATGEFKTMPVAENALFNRKRADSLGKITPARILDLMKVNSLGASKDGFTTVYLNGLFKYSSDDGESLTSIEMPKDNLTQNGGTGLYTEEFSHDWSYHNDRTTATYSSFDLLAGRYSVKGVKGAIRVPGQDIWNKFYAGEVSLDEVEGFINAYDANKTWELNGKKVYNADIYDVDEDWIAGIVVEQFTQTATTEPQKELFLVEKMVTKLDKDGVETEYIYGVYKDMHKAFEVDNTVIKKSDYQSLQPGDVLRVSLNAMGKINSIFKVFTMQKENKGDYKNGGYLMCGEETDCWADETSSSHHLGQWQDYSHEANYAGNWLAAPNVFHARVSKLTGLLGGRYFVEFGYRQGDEANPLETRLVCNYKDQYIYLFDEATGTARHASNADIDPTNPCQSVVVRARFHAAFEIVIINRAKDPGDLYFAGTFN